MTTKKKPTLIEDYEKRNEKDLAVLQQLMKPAEYKKLLKELKGG